MLVNQATLEALLKNFRAIYASAYKEYTSMYPELAMVVPSSTLVEDYAWLGRMPKMREWLDERTHQELAVYDWAIKNKDWELTLDVDRNDIEDDRLGIYTPMVQMMAAEAARHPDRLFFDLIDNGSAAAALCFDGKSFFDTLHPTPGAESSTTYDNIGSLSFTRDHLVTTIGLMTKFVDAQGEPLEVYPTHLIVHPDNAFAAQEIIASANIIIAGTAGSVTERGNKNVLEGILKIIVTPRIDAAHWYLLDCSRPIRPFAFQMRRAPETVNTGVVANPNYFERKKFAHGVDARYNAGYLLPWLAFAQEP